MHKLISRRRRRVLLSALLLSPLLAAPGAAADPPPFDLPGPGVRVTVTRGATTLPIGAVPSLAPGDRLTIAADLPEDQRTPFLLVSAFLNGATNPPPKKWIETAETWKRKDKQKTLTLTVPEGARQLILFMVPDTNGASGAIADAVRDKPGEFVRATQTLNQASLDRSRLDAFVAAIHAQENTQPEFLRGVAPLLARSLSIKLNDECLAQVVERQAACLLQNRDSLVLSDVHGSTVADTLVGAPADLAMQLSYTREAGLGLYSPYIAVIRDIARVFGAFRNPQFKYQPTLAVRRGDTMSLLLNAAPSFAKPKSVMVIAMPPVGTDSPPRLRDGGDAAICGARPGLLFSVEGAPLIFSTAFAHDVAARLMPASGAPIDLPLEARADRGGYVLKDGKPITGLRGTVKARLHGKWGFENFDGPEFTLQFPDDGAWRTTKDDVSLVVGRDNAVTLTGPAPACVESITLRTGGARPRALAWKPGEDGAVTLDLPLKDAQPGDVAIEVRQYGAAAPSTVRLRAYREASRLDTLNVHAGDDWAMLSGQRLDQVAAVEVNGVRMTPAELTRDGQVDRLRVAAPDHGQVRPTDSTTARVRLTDGRVLPVSATIAPARPRVSLIGKSATPKAPGGRFEGFDDGVLPDNATLDFSVRAGDGTTLLPSDAIEIATESELAKTRLGMRLESGSVLLARFDPAVLGPSVSGPLKFRLTRGTETSDWQPLATLVRLPRIDTVDCAGEPTATCTLRGDGLYLIDSIQPGGDGGASIPLPRGFTERTIQFPAPADGKLHVRLRDAPDHPVVLAAGSSPAG